MTHVKKTPLTLFFTGLLGIILPTLGCLKADEYPKEPRITFKRMEIDSQNRATLYLDFTDGDGNFGLEPGENTQLPDSCVKRYNLFIDPFEMQHGAWVNVTDDPCISSSNIPLYYSVPWAKPSGQIPSQKGEIKIELSDGWYKVNQYDTLRFEIYILDRDFQKSNVLTTPIYLKP